MHPQQAAPQQAQVIRCRCGVDQWANARFCSACGTPFGYYPVAMAPAPQVQTVRVFSAGRRWRVLGFFACVFAFPVMAASPGAGGALLFFGFFSFVVGRLMA